MSRMLELKLKRDIQTMVNVMDMWLSEGYVVKSRYGTPGTGPVREISETMTNIVLNADKIYCTKHIRAFMYNMMSTISPNNTTIVQMIGHLHPIHREISLMSENIFGSCKLNDEFNWAKFIFPHTISKLESRDSENVILPEFKHMGSIFSLFISRFLSVFYEDYRDILISYGKLNHIVDRVSSTIPGTSTIIHLDTDYSDFDSIFKIIKINIIKSFLDSADVSDIDVIVASVAENLGREFTYSNINNTYMIPHEKLISFVEIFIYGLTNEYDVVYSILCNLTDTKGSTDNIIREIEDLIVEYKKFEEICVTDFSKIIGLEVLIDFILEYLIESDIEKVIDITTKIGIFNDIISNIMKIKYFLDAEIECGSVSHETHDNISSFNSENKIK